MINDKNFIMSFQHNKIQEDSDIESEEDAEKRNLSSSGSIELV